MNDLGCWRLRNLLKRAGLLKLGLMILACFAADVGRAQNSFALPQGLTGICGSVTNNNVGGTGTLPIAGNAPNQPLWYRWTAPMDGEVELDTLSGTYARLQTNVYQYATNVFTVTNNFDTVLAVFTGNNPTTLNQVAANDDLYPQSQINQTGQNIYVDTNNLPYGCYSTNAPYAAPVFGYYYQPFGGPSGLRFNAVGGTTYYFVADTKSSTNRIVLNWAYHSSGVFRFATEDIDFATGKLLYECADTESQTPVGEKGNVDAQTVVHTYYYYNNPGVLVTVTRVAGSSGRVRVNYTTSDGPTNSATGDIAAQAGVDYQPVSGTLIFDDFEMSKTILIPIIRDGGTNMYRPNRDFTIVLTSAQLAPNESTNVSPPRVDSIFGQALVRILDVDIDPRGESSIAVVDTNAANPWLDPPTDTIPNLETNIYYSTVPTNAVLNFQKAHYRVSRDVTNWWGATPVTVYVNRTGTNTGTATVNWRVNNFFLDLLPGNDQQNIYFPLQPGSDYAMPDPPNVNALVMGAIPPDSPDFFFPGGNFGTLSWAANDFQPKAIHFTVYNPNLTKFDEDFSVQLYVPDTVNPTTVADQVGMVAETTVTILFDDQHPPAGSVDELYNADYNLGMSLGRLVPVTVPSDDQYPGADGEVYDLAVLPNDETIIVGDFASYNDTRRNCIALVNTDGQLDTSFDPGRGANDFINAIALTSGNQFVIGGAFTSFNGIGRGHIARVNADGSLDNTFLNGLSGADGTNIWAVEVQQDGRILIGGDFTHVNGVPRNHLARLNADGSLDAGFDSGTTFNGPVYALALPANVAITVNRIAAGATNEDDQVVSLGTATAGVLTVDYDMQQIPDDMRVFYGSTNVAGGTGVLVYDSGYVSGTGHLVIPFGPTNGLATNYITIVMDQGGGPAGTLWSYTASVVTSVGGGIMVGGNFAVSGQHYRDIARVNFTDGLLDTSFNPIVGADNSVFALSWQPNGQVLLGGAFTHVNDQPFNHLARMNIDGSTDNTNFFIGIGANDVVYSVDFHTSFTTNVTYTTNLDASITTNFNATAHDSIYVGGPFTSFNGTHRLGFARLYSDGTVDTTFLDTAYNQFAGLPRLYFGDSPGAVYAAGFQSDDNVIIGGSFDEVGGGQADKDIRNNLCLNRGIDQSFGNSDLWVSQGRSNIEPKTRDGVRNRSNVARLIGGAICTQTLTTNADTNAVSYLVNAHAPGNIGLVYGSYSANESKSSRNVELVRTNGGLGAAGVNFAVQPGLANNGVDYTYYANEPLYWITWEYTGLPTRMHSHGLFGIGGYTEDIYGRYWWGEGGIASLSTVQVGVDFNPNIRGDLNAQFQLANPAGADQFYLGGQNIPLGTALGRSASPFTLIDDIHNSGQFGFASTNFIATGATAAISVLRSNGTYGIVSMDYSTSDGTAVVGTDYTGLTNQNLQFLGGDVSEGFNVTILNSGYIYTNFPEKTVNLHLSDLSAPSDGYATFGISNAVIRLINPNYQGYLTFSGSGYTGKISDGFLTFVVNRVCGSKGSVSVQYLTYDGTALNKTDYTGTTNTLHWDSGDVSPRTVSIPLLPNTTVGASKLFYASLTNATLNGTNWPSLFHAGSPGSLTNATLTILNDNSSGTLQFSAPSYTVNEDGGQATITVIRTGGAVGTASVQYATSDGTATNGLNYTGATNTLSFAAGQTAASFTVPIIPDGVVDTNNFYFNVILTNNAALGSPSNAVVKIVDAESYNRPPGSTDTSFTGGDMNGDVLALALQTDGQILAGGSFTYVGDVNENYITRLNPDGSPDMTFLNGYSGANGAVRSVVNQTDDRILIGGDFSSINGINYNHIARLMTDGSLDTSFDPGSGADGAVYAMAEAFIGNDREIYVGGAFGSINSSSSPRIARMNNDGTVDASFATGSGADGAVYAIAVYPTNSVYNAGKVLIGGAFTNYNRSNFNHIVCLNADGSVDTNFNLGSAADDAVLAIAIQIDGKVLVGGSFTNFNGTNFNHIVRLNTDGSVDTSFVTNLNGGVNSTVEGIALQSDNDILLVGQFSQANGVTRNRITRLLPTGAVDPTINFGDGANGDIDAVLVQPVDQMIVIGGVFTQFNDQPHNHIARLYGGSMTGSGAFMFSSANYQVNENGGVPAAITISRTGGTSGTNSVDFDTSDGSAVAGPTGNYTAVHTTVTFPPGEVLETVAVPVRDDGVITNDLTVNLEITNATPPAALGDQSTATLTILNDDTAVSFASASYSVIKNVLNGVATIDIVRIGGTNGGACSVDFYTTTNGTAVAGSDYIPTNTTVTFNSGQSNVTVQVPILTNIFGRPEGNKTVGLLLTNAINTVLYAPSNATLTIIDNISAPGQLYFAATNYVVNEGDANAYLTVVRTNGSSGSISVTYFTTPGTAQPVVNYTTVSNTVTFGPGVTSMPIVVPLVDNNLVQGTVSLTVSLTGATNLIAPTNATLNILDNDVGVAFVNATNYVIETAGTESVFVQRLGATNAAFQVDYSTADGLPPNGATSGVNYTAEHGTLVFPGGATLGVISIPLLYDTNVTGDLKFTVGLSNSTAGVRLVSPSNTVVVVQDADASLSFTNSAMSVYKNAGNAVITVVCSNPNVEPLSVHYFTSDGTATNGVNYTAVSGTLTFAGGIRTNTFNVPIINNGLIKGDYAFTVSLTNATPPGQLGSPSNQVVTIIDNEPSVRFSSPTYTVLKSGVSASIAVLRTNFTDIVTSVGFSTTNGTAIAGSDYISTNGTITFTNGETSKNFSVTVINNTAVQPDKTVLLQLFNPANGVLVAPYAATLTIHDNSGSYVIPAGSTLTVDPNGNGIIDPGETVSLLFAFRDAGGNNVTDLWATLLATNGITSPSGLQEYGSLTMGGPSKSRPFSFTAVGTNGQQIVATFQLQDGTNNLGTNGFTYTLGTWTETFYNTNIIIIRDTNMAVPYPSTIAVSGVGGVVIKATVTLTNLTHTYPKDIDVLLVSPGGQDTLIMAHAGINPVKKVTLTFDDAAANFLNYTNITSGTYKPTYYLLLPIFP